MVKNDIGFDLVPISIFFDPIKLPTGEQLLLTNPLLNSALLHSAKDTNELKYLLLNILNALEESREVVNCYMRGPFDRPCEGDQITPYIWIVYENSIMKSKGIKYLAALPLFDPLIVINNYSYFETRQRLRNNLEAGICRLIALCAEKLRYTVGSIGFAALGGTSHKGGDSRYFLNFDESFLTILKALELSYSSPVLKRVYFVAFEKHTGVFQKDALDALFKICEYLAIKNLLYFKNWGPLFVVVFFLLLMISILSYRNLKQVISRGNRWKFLGSLLGITFIMTSFLIFSTSVVFSLIDILHYQIVYYWYGGISFLLIIGISWLCKKI